MNRREAVATAALFGGVLVLYLATMPTALPSSGDARAEVARALLLAAPTSPHHPVLTPTYRTALGLAEHLGVTLEPFVILQTVNSVAGAAGAALFYVLGRSLGASMGVSLLTSVVLALSYGHWFHSREVETGIVALTFSIAAAVAVASAAREPHKVGRLVRCAIAGSLAAFGIVCNLGVALIVPALALFALLSDSGGPHAAGAGGHGTAAGWRPSGGHRGSAGSRTSGAHRRADESQPSDEHGGSASSQPSGGPPRPGRRLGRAAPAAVFLVMAVGLALTVYAVAYSTASEADGALAWIAGHPSGSRLAGIGRATPENALRAASGLVNTLVGHTASTTAAKLHLRGGGSVTVPVADAVTFAAGALLAAGLIIAVFVRVPGRVPLAWRAATALAVVLVAAFNLLWLGSDPQFWLPALPFLLGYAALVATSATRAVSVGYRALLSGAALLLLFVNFALPVPTFADRDGGVDWQAAQALAASTGPRDVLLHAGGWGSYVEAIGSQRTTSLVYGVPGHGDDYVAHVRNQVIEAAMRGGRVYALEVFETTSPGAIGEWEKIYVEQGVTQAKVVSALRGVGRWEPVDEDLYGRSLWVLDVGAGH